MFKPTPLRLLAPALLLACDARAPGKPGGHGSDTAGASPADSGGADGGSTDGGSTDGGSTDGGSTDGGDPGVVPTAVMNCPTEPVVWLPRVEYAPPRHGRGSVDPLGEGLSYEWTTIAAPYEVLLTPPDLRPSAEANYWSCPAMGDFEVQLRVRDAAGTWSEPALCRYSCVPGVRFRAEQIADADGRVDMYTTLIDLDLHVTSNAAGLFSRPGDSCFCHPEDAGPDLDRPEDDVLALGGDDHIGQHVEVAASDDPQSGTMTVWVHGWDVPDVHRYYFPKSTVRVYVDGVLVEESVRRVSEDHAWEVGTVSWPEGAWAPAEGPLVEERARMCE
jgi:hypothetical protein